MKRITHPYLAFLLLLIVGLAQLPATAQTHTPKYVSMCSKSKGYYEYLPQGYDPAGTTTYPLILFMTGIGEFGDGSSSQLPTVLKNGITKLIKEGTFPKSFTAGGKTFRFIVITPQFLKGSAPTAADMNTVLNYVVSHYKVNTKRIYITGLSYGGGLSFAYPGSSSTYASRVAAIVPIASPYPDGGDATIYSRSRTIAAGNVPVWATHNKYDRAPDSSTNTIKYINAINQSPAPKPPAKMTIFSASGHDAWGKTYDPDYRENGYNVYEWMLLHEKGSAPPAPNAAPKASAGSDKSVTLPTNSVTLSGSGTDADGTIASYSWKQLYGPSTAVISSPTSASTSITSLVQGYYHFRLTVSDNVSAKATDDVMVTVNYVNISGTRYVNVNVYGGANGYSSTAWNNWSVGTGAGTNKTSSAFKYSDGTTSSISAVLSATTTVSDNGSTYGCGMAPSGVLRHTSYYTGTRTLTIKGLSLSKTYNLQLFASRNSSTAANTIFKVNSTSVTINAYNNHSSKAVFNNITPNSSGQIVITIDKSNTYNYLNGFVITENAGTRFVKGNIYGGSNAYSNVEWNNWNVGTSSGTNKSSGSLKYSDGTTSKVNALLSITSGINDNGSTYGSGMAPAPVLRYSSYYNGTRKLTFSGLSTSKTYNLELYASRNTTTAGNTIFTINSTVKTISASKNLTNKASFTNLKANSSGQIVVTISKSATNDYLNGFMLTEVSPTTSGLTVQEAPVTQTQSAVPSNEVAEPIASTINLYPNPVASDALLTLHNTYNGAVLVQLLDETGASHKEFRLVKNAADLQQAIPMADVPKGVYYILVQMGRQTETRKVLKL